MSEFSKVEFTAKTNAGNLRHYGNLDIILNGTSDDWEVYGFLVIESVAYFLDVIIEELTREDAEELLRQIQMRMARMRRAAEYD